MTDKRKYADRKEYLIQAVAKRPKVIRQRAIEYKGGKCVRCNYNTCTDALDFHHIDGKKEFSISQNGLTRSWARVEKEIQNCILLCANCHREEHAQLRSLSQKSESEE
jgi:5-methylcytosine-specific restriction endonuclease McrA